MIRKVSKDFIIFITLIPLLLWGAFFISSRMEQQLPSYSVINKSGVGLSVFFDGLKELGYTPERTIKPINDDSIGYPQIVVKGGNFDVNSEDVKKWVEKGGVLVYLIPGTSDDVQYGEVGQKEGNIFLHKYHQGVVIVTDIEGITNKTLTKETNHAYELLQQIDQYNHGKIVFNEHHLFSPSAKKSLWGYIPIEYKFILYQLLLVVAGFFYYKGKRFGKPIPLHEEVERTENEYLYSAATLYRQGKCWDLITEYYYRSFRRELNCSYENWLEYWEQKQLPSYHEAQRVYEFMSSSKTKVKTKEYIQMIMMMEKLKPILTKRRDSYWKALKRTQ